VDADLAYLCGLMADVGASLLLWVEGDRGGGGDGARAALRRYHEELGATLLERWGFEPAVVAFARQHHPLAEPSPTTAYAKVGIVASELAAQLLGDDDPTGAGPVPAALMSRCASELQLSDAVFGRLMAQLQTELSVVVQTVG
jgi:HD-like signal output (HDOD) protein